MDRKPILVTKPALAPLEEFLPYLEEIWETRWLTNSGPFHQKLEAALAEYLNVKHVVLCNNGTSALLLALRVLGLQGEVITTPYSFIATGHAIIWAGLEPVFVDIGADSCNLNPEHLEAAITERTAAIMPVHCYGNPCETEAIGRIAKKHGIPVVYDAAHAFGVVTESGSLLNEGDLSVVSFHATKVFNTFEGGAIICHDDAMRKKLEYLRNFGFEDETHIPEIGVNAKLNEFQSALGLLQLQHLEEWLTKRAELSRLYSEGLNDVVGLQCGAKPWAKKPNYAYFPIMINEEYPYSRDEVVDMLRAREVHVRRYFYPLITDFPLYRNARCVPASLPNARRSADSVICLPIYPDLLAEDVRRTCEYLRCWAVPK
ncbi:DegT/DnrJ/EryC1/StrS family aminotransferase [Gilvimarinus sp. SDUM040013]|uniref:DegT/DnrJ/EryC1/StrS family aminotransferase n=1 Tax=Gilvimarinus gilvus TaxID=3058038 RepID=A0ABU4RZI1_9GAMM|nr:DegT/DnrJ/EryC1/StrS family aminotransferase [Gilvimarinus sp. SDUM040013]MDO3387319.1 DegT/DnrJ/EryC1/StrS family aminotransferase [Gilvimarinus sp. SDUM040013]MDX6849008.1 DegT/DnrJ/EryC1/StrS family aminotransferase [Gilvimarinus sp. SDUM040013]